MASPAIGIGLFMLVVILGAIGVSIVAAIVRWRDRVRQPCCGECRYPVEGLTTFTCPECGKDLREAGILVPGVRPRHRVHVAELIAATAAACVLCGMITVGLLSSVPGGRVTHFTRTTTVEVGSAGFGPLVTSATGRTAAQGSLSAAPAQRISLVEQSSGSAPPRVLEADMARGTWRVMNGPGTTPTAEVHAGRLPIGAGDVSAWLSGGGARTASQEQLDALAAYINGGGVNAAAPLTVSGSGFGTMTTAAPWVMWAGAGAWLVIFGVVTWLIVYGNRARSGRRGGG
ncbi:MAG: hypothetical protein KF699_03005 [Phycisphaeraceae bacterium]|nr:hypothetical protein [Phycisphaeraceae bacterium]